jgi:hypothetical protein
MSLQKSTLALTITLALDASTQEVESVIEKIEDFFKINEPTIDPVAIATGQVAQATTAPAAAPSGAGRPSVEAMAASAPIGERDTAGLPWDERIHSSTKSKNADGTWRIKRGTSPQVVGKVTKELQATVAAVPAAAPAALPAPPTPGLPPVPGANVAPPANPAYTAFVQFVTSQPRITDDWLKQCLIAYGVADGSLQNLAHRPDLIPAIEAGIKQALGQ